MTETFTIQYLNFEIRGTLSESADGITTTCSYECDAFPDPEATYAWMRQKFTSLTKLKRALDAYELSLRKNFTNTSAFLIHRNHNNDKPSEYERVTITSVTQDGKEVWVQTKTGRRRVNVASLYSSEAAVKHYVCQYDESRRLLKVELQELQDVLDRFLWAPLKGST